MCFINVHDCAKETRHQAIDYSFMLMYSYIANWICNLELTRNLPICVHGDLWGNHYQLKRDTHNTKSCQVKTTWPRPVAPRSNNRSVDRPLSTLVVFIFVLVENFIGCIICCRIIEVVVNFDEVGLWELRFLLPVKVFRLCLLICLGLTIKVYFI